MNKQALFLSKLECCLFSKIIYGKTGPCDSLVTFHSSLPRKRNVGNILIRVKEQFTETVETRKH